MSAADRDVKAWEAYFQSGGGFAGYPYQRGASLASWFSGLFRTALPVLKSIGKKVGKEALRTGLAVASDGLAGENVVESLKKHGRASAREVVDDMKNRLEGAGRRKRRPRRKRNINGGIQKLGVVRGRKGRVIRVKKPRRKADLFD